MSLSVIGDIITSLICRSSEAAHNVGKQSGNQLRCAKAIESSHLDTKHTKIQVSESISACQSVPCRRKWIQAK